MERNNNGEVISITWQESELRESYFKVLSIDAQINRLKKEREEQQLKMERLLDDGVELYLSEVDETKIKNGWF